jgi:predicted ATP-grasp superfamily ATP-dependent carboligase
MKDKNYPPAFVTYGWCRNAYTVVRSLGRMGVEVHVGDSSSLAMSRVSRYCKSFTKLPDFFVEPERYFQEVCKALKKTGAKVVLPGHEDMGIFCKWQDDLPPGVVVALPDKDTYELVEDKFDCIELARKHGCPTPWTVKIYELSDLERFSDSQDWPLVIKTRIGNGSKGIRIVTSFDDLTTKFKELIEQYGLGPDRWPVIQEYLPGQIAWASVLYEKGRCVAKSSCRPLRHKELDIEGNATLRETGDYDDLVSRAIALMDAVRWHGIAQLEFIPNRQGDYVLTEINARPWGSISLPVCSGVDMPYLWYLIALDKLGPEMVIPYRKVKCKWILGEGIALIESLKRAKLSNVLKIFRPQWGCYYDDFSLTDPLPLVFESFDYLVRFIKWGGSLNPVTENMIR